jgi:hypothetical protein
MMAHYLDSSVTFEKCKMPCVNHYSITQNPTHYILLFMCHPS